MPKYIDSLDVDSVLDGRMRRDLFTEDDQYRQDIFERTIERASDIARAAAQNAGYLTGDGNEHESGMVRVATLAAFIHLAYGRRQRSIPDSTAAMLGSMLEAVRIGDLPIPDISTEASAAHGGGEFSNGSGSGLSGLSSSRNCPAPVMTDLGSDW